MFRIVRKEELRPTVTPVSYTHLAAMYQSRIGELNGEYGAYTVHEAALDHGVHMLAVKTDSMQELTYADRKRVHNLKYYTWVEQQGLSLIHI